MVRTHSTYGCCGAAVSQPLDKRHTCKARPETAEAVVASRAGPSSKPAPKARPGAATEALLRQQLKAAGFILWRDYIAEWAWGILLEPPRLFRADAGFYAQDLCVEIVGGAHAAGRRKVRSDVERQGLAATLGLKVLTLTPEQVKQGEAIDLIEAALNAGELQTKETPHV